MSPIGQFDRTAWMAMSDLVEHPVPGGIDPPGIYTWDDGCMAIYRGPDDLEVWRPTDHRRKHRPDAQPLRAEPLPPDAT